MKLEIVGAIVVNDTRRMNLCYVPNFCEELVRFDVRMFTSIPSFPMLKISISKRFDRGKCDCRGLMVPKSKRKGRQDGKKPPILRTNLIRSG
jgi:hypothetical protein